MKVKRQKNNRRLMQLYCTSFGFREPYQIIVDGTFATVALKYRLDIRTALPSTLGADAKLFTTPCIVAEMRALRSKSDQDMMGAVLASRRFESRKCGHDGTKSARDCLTDLIGTTNPQHLMVATQDVALRKHLRTVPGTPLVYLAHSVIVLEPHSHVTLDHVAAHEAAKGKADTRELATLLKEDIEQGRVTPGELLKQDSAPPMPKRKKAKGPNPLSCKKKKSKTQPTASTTKRPAPPKDLSPPSTSSEPSVNASTTKKRKLDQQDDSQNALPNGDDHPSEQSESPEAPQHKRKRRKRGRGKSLSASAVATPEQESVGAKASETAS